MKNNDRNSNLLSRLNKLTGEHWNIARGYTESSGKVWASINVDIIDSTPRPSRLGDVVTDAQRWGKDVPTLISNVKPNLPIGVKLEERDVYSYKPRSPLIKIKNFFKPVLRFLGFKVYEPEVYDVKLYYITDPKSLDLLANYDPNFQEKQEALAKGAVNGLFADKLSKDVSNIIGSYVGKDAGSLARVNKGASVKGREALAVAKQVIEQRNNQGNESLGV